jgi:hypothetical protein
MRREEMVPMASSPVPQKNKQILAQFDLAQDIQRATPHI